MLIRASTVSAVSASVGEDKGCVTKSNVFVTAVAPKLVPSDQASRCTRNHAPRSPVVRSMQRRMARQQRTVRLLTVMVIVIALAAAIFNIAIVASTDRKPAQPEAPAQVESATPGEGQSQPGKEETGIDRAFGSLADDEEPVQEEMERVVEPPAELPFSFDPPTVSGFIAEYQRALALIVQAEDPARAVSDRLGDYEEALLILRNIADTAPEDEQPEDLPQHIGTVESAIEALR